MGAYAGTAGSVVLVINGTTSVDELAQWEANFTKEQFTYQKFGATWTHRHVGASDVTGRATGQWDQSDATGQRKLKNAWVGGSIVELRLYDGGTNYWSGSAYISDIGQVTPQAGLVTCDFAFAGSGGVWTYT